MGFECHFKFYLLRTLVNEVVSSFGAGRMDHNNRALNQLATATVQVVPCPLSLCDDTPTLFFFTPCFVLSYVVFSFLPLMFLNSSKS